MSTRTNPTPNSGNRPAIRLSHAEVQGIKRAVCEVYGPRAKIWVFGSRADPCKKAGDIDLLLEVDPAHNDVSHELHAQVLLEKYLGEQRIDLIVTDYDLSDAPPIVRIARETGVLI